MIDDFPFQSTFPKIKLAVKDVIEVSRDAMDIYSQGFISGLNDDSEPVMRTDIYSNEIIKKILQMCHEIIKPTGKKW